MEKFDIVIIGGGPSGYAAAMRAIDLGNKVAIVERHKLGGAGVFNGALSSKTLWEISNQYRLMQNTGLGYQIFDVNLDYSGVINAMHNATHEKYKQLKSQVNGLAKSSDLRYFAGNASFLSPNEVSIVGDDEQVIYGKSIILATGSRPRILPHIPVDEQIITTSDGLANFSDFPKSIVILGAGVIGCEFATIFSNFGKTKVYLIDKQERILPFEDEDIANVVARNLEENGVTIHRGAQLKRMDIVNGQVEYELTFDDGRNEIYTVEKGLLSVGRVPNYETLNLEKAGIHPTDRGYIKDEDTKTEVPHIYAVGDLTADVALVNVAELEGRHAAELASGVIEPEVSYNNISSIMFLNPEVAAVGLNELTARKGKIPYRIATLRFEFINRAIAMRRTQGLFKLMVTDDDEMKVLGMRVVGAHASSTIQAISLLINMGQSIKVIAETVHAHPSMPEGLQECARMLMGKSIVKPDALGHSNCYRVSENGEKTDINFLVNSPV